METIEKKLQTFNVIPKSNLKYLIHTRSNFKLMQLDFDLLIK